MVVYIAAQTGTALLLAASAFVAGVAAEREVLTSYHCRTPDVPTRVIKENSPTDFAVLFAAVQRGDCTYSPKRMSVTPLLFAYGQATATAVRSVIFGKSVSTTANWPIGFSLNPCINVRFV
jgi:hypothetical protein